MKPRNLREKYRMEGMNHGRDACDAWMLGQSGSPRYPVDVSSKPEKYGFIHRSSKLSDLNDKYRWGWIDGFETEAVMKINRFYSASFVYAGKFIAEHNLVRVDGELSSNTDAWMQCPLCGHISIFTGTLHVPYTTKILCITCGNLMPRESYPLFVHREHGSDQSDQSGQPEHGTKTE